MSTTARPARSEGTPFPAPGVATSLQRAATAAQVQHVDPNRSVAYKLRATALAGLGRRDQAIADFRKALELDPSDETVRKSLRDMGVAP